MRLRQQGPQSPPLVLTHSPNPDARTQDDAGSLCRHLGDGCTQGRPAQAPRSSWGRATARAQARTMPLGPSVDFTRSAIATAPTNADCRHVEEPRSKFKPQQNGFPKSYTQINVIDKNSLLKIHIRPPTRRAFSPLSSCVPCCRIPEEACICKFSIIEEEKLSPGLSVNDLLCASQESSRLPTANDRPILPCRCVNCKKSFLFFLSCFSAQLARQCGSVHSRVS